jgi:aminopeptidase N
VRLAPVALVVALAPAGAAAASFDTEHIKLEITLDEANRSFSARATETVRPLAGGFTSFDLDADEMRIRSVHLTDGRPLAFDATPPLLRITLDRPYAAGEPVSFAVEYDATPRRGLYFLAPGPRRPRLPRQVWTLGWPTDTRYWIPCHDDPADKVTSEIVLTASASYEAVANGELVETRRSNGRKVWRWRLEQPHSTYLMSFVAGEYEEVREPLASAPVPLSYFVYRGRSRDARRTFARTPEMLRFFSERTGLPYPFPKYAQAVAADFPYGGMENVTAVTLADSVLLDDRARIDTSSDDVIAHELAHQWWGNAVTPGRWTDVWLSEGFATFFERLWGEHDRGLDAASYARLLDADACLTLHETERGRATVFEGALDPVERLDALVYQKGALVLGMLRRILGEEAFWNGLREYLRRNAFGNVETSDFRRAMEAAAGRDLGWFFGQWLLRPGFPSLHVSHRWDESGRRIVLTVRQEQEVGATAFVLPAEARIVTAGGDRTEKLLVERSAQEFSIPCATAPLTVAFDPGAWIPKKLVAPKPPEELAYDLAHGEPASARAFAARQVAALAADSAIPLLAAAVARDPFWGVRVQAANGLGWIGGDRTLTPLRRAAKDADPRVREAALLAMARSPSAEGDLLAAARSELSEMAAGAALRALGALRSPRAFDTLARALARESHADRVRTAALAGLGVLGDKRGVPLALEQAAEGRAAALRLAAIGALRDLGRGQRVVTSRLVRLLEDRDPRVRKGAAEALGVLGDPRGRSPLRETLGMEPIASVRREMAKAVDRIEGIDERQ